MKRLFILIAVAALASVGCDKKSDTPAAGGEGTSKDNKEVTLMDDDLPVKSDFVEEAEGSITKENYKSELDKLATEIEKE